MPTVFQADLKALFRMIELYFSANLQCFQISIGNVALQIKIILNQLKNTKMKLQLLARSALITDSYIEIIE